MVTRVPTITVAAVPPTSKLEGDLWWDTSGGNEFIWYNDGNTTQWVTTHPTRYVISSMAGGDLQGYYPNPTIRPSVDLLGIPTAPTAPLGDGSRTLATTDFVRKALAGAGQLPSQNTVLFVDTLADLKALTSRPLVVYTRGYAAANDTLGTGPPWYWTSGSTVTADDYMVVNPTSNGTATGRYIRRFQSGFSPLAKWSGVGLNLPDPGGLELDVTRWNRVFAFGGVVDVSGGTYPLGVIQTIGPTSATLGIISNGSGTFVPGAGSTFTSNMIVVTKPTFFIRNVKFECPIVTDPNTHPTNSRAIYFSNTDAESWEVDSCQIKGFNNAIVMGGGGKNCRVTRNHLTGQWGDAITGLNNFDQCFITDNAIHDGGYANAAESGSGAIRIGVSSNILTARQLTISRNHIARWYTHDLGDGTIVGQSAIDCFSGSWDDVHIDNNTIEECGSIEIKTGDPPVGAFGLRGISISDNQCRVSQKFPSSCITAFYTGAVATQQMQHLKIHGNHFYAKDRLDDRMGAGGAYVSGFDDVSIDSNTVTNLNFGFAIAAPRDQTTVLVNRDITLSNNTIDATETAIYNANAGNEEISNLYIVGNPLLRGGRYGISLATGLVRSFVIRGNFIEGGIYYGIEMRDCFYGEIDSNTIRGGANAIMCQAETVTDVLIENNNLRNYVPPPTNKVRNAVVVSPGTGLTTGLRTFTVAGGTTTRPARIYANVVAGSISGTIVGFADRGDYTALPGNPAGVSAVDSGATGGVTFNLTGFTAAMLKMFSATVATVGAGYTNGSRAFTMVGGTFIRPAKVRCTVVGGVIVDTLPGGAIDIKDILDPGEYTVFPTNPVSATVDSGGGSGATFTLNQLSPGYAIHLSSAANLTIQKNDVFVRPDFATAIFNAANNIQMADNCRGTISTDPNGAYAGDVGDFFYTSTTTTTGIRRWDCIAQGTQAGAIWRPTYTPSGVPVTKTASFTVAPTESEIICNIASPGIATLPVPATFPGRQLKFTNRQAQTVVSATANVVQAAGGAATTAILPATVGSRVTLVSDKVNWIVLG